MNYLKKPILLILIVWLVFVSCNIYKYSADDWYCISHEELNKTYFEKNSTQKFELYESKLGDLNLYKNVKYDFKLLVKAEWIKSVLTRISDVSYFSFSSYTIRLSNIEVFKDFMRIYPFNFFF
jgi:hypothetical protein